MKLRTQSKRASFAEAVVSTFVGYLIAYVATIILFRMYGVSASQAQIVQITLWMTALSIGRGYLIRRLFNSEFWKRHGKVDHA